MGAERLQRLAFLDQIWTDKRLIAEHAVPRKFPPLLNIGPCWIQLLPEFFDDSISPLALRADFHSTLDLTQFLLSFRWEPMFLFAVLGESAFVRLPSPGFAAFI